MSSSAFRICLSANKWLPAAQRAASGRREWRRIMRNHTLSSSDESVPDMWLSVLLIPHSLSPSQTFNARAFHLCLSRSFISNKPSPPPPPLMEAFNASLPVRHAKREKKKNLSFLGTDRLRQHQAFKKTPKVKGFSRSGRQESLNPFCVVAQLQ